LHFDRLNVLILSKEVAPYSLSFKRRASHRRTAESVSRSLKPLGKMLLVVNMLRDVFITVTISSSATRH
jgi:hypothetical protein